MQVVTEAVGDPPQWAAWRLCAQQGRLGWTGTASQNVLCSERCLPLRQHC